MLSTTVEDPVASDRRLAGRRRLVAPIAGHLDRFAHGLTRAVELRLYPCLSLPEGLQLPSCLAVLQPSDPLTITTSAQRHRLRDPFYAYTLRNLHAL